MIECVSDVLHCPDCGAITDWHVPASTVDYRSLAIEILDDLVSAAGYIGDYFWVKWYEDEVARYRKLLGLEPQDALQ